MNYLHISVIFVLIASCTQFVDARLSKKPYFISTECNYRASTLATTIVECNNGRCLSIVDSSTFRKNYDDCLAKNYKQSGYNIIISLFIIITILLAIQQN